MSLCFPPLKPIDQLCQVRSLLGILDDELVLQELLRSRALQETLPVFNGANIS